MVKDITPKYEIIPISESVFLDDDGLGVRVGGLGGKLATEVNDAADKADNAINSDYNIITDIINDNLDTSAKQILSDFTFKSTDYVGAFKTGDITWNAAGAITGGSGSVYNAKGLIFATDGTPTITLNGITGDATFAGNLSAASGTLGTITAGTLEGVTMAIGSDNAIFKATASGIQLGHATFGSAPFRVDMDGNLVATSATITGSITVTGGDAFSKTNDDLDDVDNGTSYSRVKTTDISAGHIVLTETYKANGSDKATLDELGDGSTYGRIKTTDISAGHIVLSETTGDLDDIDDGTTYGKVKNTQISAGEIILSAVSGDLDDIDDGTTYGKIKITDISSGHIVLSETTGDLDDIDDGDNYGKVALTDISAGHITVVSQQASININDTVFGNQGVQLQYNSGTPRAYIGDGANKYFKFDGTNISWKAQNTELDTDGNLTATNATIRGSLNASDIETGTLIGIDVQSSSGNDRIVLDNGDRIYFYSGGILEASMRGASAGGLWIENGANLYLQNNKALYIEDTTGSSDKFGGISIDNENDLIIIAGTTNDIYFTKNDGTSVLANIDQDGNIEIAGMLNTTNETTPDDGCLMLPNGGNQGRIYVAGTDHYLVINQRDYDTHDAVGFDNLGDTNPESSGIWDLGRDINRFNTIYLTSSPDVSSDINLKKNINNIDYGLDDILKLNPVSFNWKKNTKYKNKDKKQIGLIAQEVKDIIPEIATETSYQPASLVPVLVKAIQELSEKFETLEKELNNIKK